jgi:hypothetical protein
MDSTLRSRRTRLKLSYFQRRLDWSSTDWNPSLAVKEGTTYVSWNGATEVESWNFISMGNFVALRKKTDFETAMKLDELLGQDCVSMAVVQGGEEVRMSNTVSWIIQKSSYTSIIKFRPA